MTAPITHPIDPSAQKFGLSDALLLPIAALDDGALRTYVGIPSPVPRRSCRDVLLVKPYPPLQEENPGWDAEFRLEYRKLVLLPQVWVHPDYDAYREAYDVARRESAPDLRDCEELFLDHVMNRDHARQLGYGWLRLCPVPPEVNTNAGHRSGGERNAVRYVEEAQRKGWMGRITISKVVYADPFDLTKMMGMKPGTIREEGGGLEGVAAFRKNFYPTSTNS
jgi:hypothetical protein